MTREEKERVDQEFGSDITILNSKKIMKMTLKEYRKFRLLLCNAFQIAFNERSEK